MHESDNDLYIIALQFIALLSRWVQAKSQHISDPNHLSYCSNVKKKHFRSNQQKLNAYALDTPSPVLSSTSTKSWTFKPMCLDFLFTSHFLGSSFPSSWALLIKVSSELYIDCYKTSTDCPMTSWCIYTISLYQLLLSQKLFIIFPY